MRRALCEWALSLAPGRRTAYLGPTPTAAELAQGANHLLYKVQMLSNTVGLAIIAHEHFTAPAAALK